MHSIAPTLPRLGIHSGLQDSGLIRSEFYLGGTWRSARDGALLAVRNPATGEWIGSVASAGASDVTLAIEAARLALPAWRALTPDARGALLRQWALLMRQNREDLARIMTTEQGKPLTEARGEIDYAASFLDWFAEEGRRNYGETIPSHLPGRQLLTVRQPLGVTAAITPWNFPSAMITRKAGAALAAGCTMIVRPADETPFSAIALAVLAERAGIPAGVFSVLTGDARTIATELTASNVVRGLSFTGSTQVGRLLLQQCAQTVKRVSLELGGHAPFIVFEDAQVAQMAALACEAKFQTSGQDCLAANRILVARRIYDDFVKTFVAQTARLRVGPGLEPGVDIGPLISARAVERCQRQIDDAVARGAKLLTTPQATPLGPLFMQPAVLVDVPRDALIWREETFGPLAAITPFTDEREAIELANDTDYGLAAYVCTQDLSRALRVSQSLEYGMVAVNTARFTGPPIPFGGWKQSGLGREGSKHGLEEFTELQYLCLQIQAA